MKMIRIAPALPVLLCMAGAHAQAGTQVAYDAFAPVYVVSSPDTYRKSLDGIARNAQNRRDGGGNDVVISEVSQHQLPEVTGRIHSREQRCGGFFSFDSRAEAEAFVHSAAPANAGASNPIVYTIDNQATVMPWLPQVREENIYRTIKHLSTAYPNRYYASANAYVPSTWIRDAWLGLAAGRDDVNAVLFPCSSCGNQYSVILSIEGSEEPDEIVVLGAHLDSIAPSSGTKAMLAPGADDDASGIATLTEVLRVALTSGWKPKRTVMFMAYAAEEVGLRGSLAIADSFKTGGKKVVGVLQLDMTNYKSGNGPDLRLVTDNSDPALQSFVSALFQEYLAPVGPTLGSFTCGYGCSDHASWTIKGFPSAMLFEAGDDDGGYFPYIHSPHDKLENMGDSAGRSVYFAQMALAFMGEVGKTASGTLGKRVADVD
ncbi:M20/M25/M40 family metallo-hydrolase [Luteimonas sp. SX5]|uniref:M20/M25/M40 family metallo-hydrolase n=1 Tax=Luteimonas galliterrae TaxID=2940486 RepID=A0ABT0MFK6_9GAMM|nr:M20/M25/M40 family metallo-hydrolase [Luteimonas galliterrae]MCL1633637.1 M20/M25/M40 family metallo-hydrolase [Luteimonas galliterrae]